MKFYVLEGLSETKIIKHGERVWEESVLSLTTPHRWITEFKSGRRNVEDKPYSGLPKTAITQEIID